MTMQDSTTKYDGYARGGALVTPQWLEEHLLDPALRVVEVDVSPAAYDAGHIDGAVLWNVYQDLKDADYRLVDTAALDRLVENGYLTLIHVEESTGGRPASPRYMVTEGTKATKGPDGWAA